MRPQKLKIYFWGNFGWFVGEISADIRIFPIIAEVRSHFFLWVFAWFSHFSRENLGNQGKRRQIWDRIPELPYLLIYRAESKDGQKIKLKLRWPPNLKGFTIPHKMWYRGYRERREDGSLLFCLCSIRGEWRVRCVFTSLARRVCYHRLSEKFPRFFVLLRSRCRNGGKREEPDAVVLYRGFYWFSQRYERTAYAPFLFC